LAQSNVIACINSSGGRGQVIDDLRREIIAKMALNVLLNRRLADTVER
jgi:hypothetical protein